MVESVKTTAVWQAVENTVQGDIQLPKLESSGVAQAGLLPPRSSSPTGSLRFMSLIRSRGIRTSLTLREITTQRDGFLRPAASR